MEGLEAEDPDLVEQIRRLMFVFEDILLATKKASSRCSRKWTTTCSRWPSRPQRRTQAKDFQEHVPSRRQLIQEDMQYMGPCASATWSRRSRRSSTSSAGWRTPARSSSAAAAAKRKWSSEKPLIMPLIKAQNFPRPSRRFSLANIEAYAAAMLTRSRQQGRSASRRRADPNPNSSNADAVADGLAEGRKKGLAQGMTREKKRATTQALAEHRQKLSAAVTRSRRPARNSKRRAAPARRRTRLGHRACRRHRPRVAKRQAELNRDVLLANLTGAMKLVCHWPTCASPCRRASWPRCAKNCPTCKWSGRAQARRADRGCRPFAAAAGFSRPTAPSTATWTRSSIAHRTGSAPAD